MTGTELALLDVDNAVESIRRRQLTPAALPAVVTHALQLTTLSALLLLLLLLLLLPPQWNDLFSAVVEASFTRT